MEMYQKGDRVWTVERGHGTVNEVLTCLSVKYPVEVSFDDGTADSFTRCGRRIESHRNPVLFFEPFAIPKIKRPLPKIQVDTMVRVKDSKGDVWKNRYFSHFDEEGKIICFNNGSTSWSSGTEGTTSWNFYEVV